MNYDIPRRLKQKHKNIKKEEAYMAEKRNKDGSIRKIGSGRTRGAKSLCSIKLSDLTAKFGPDSMIVVGSVFCRKAGLSTDTPAVSAPISEEVKSGIQLVEI